MGIFSPSFVLGLIVLFYLLSFVLFALIRIATGISIQRVGYLSFRHIAYTPRDGVRIELRSLGLHLHRPTFARPTWCSLRLTELKVTLDLGVLVAGKDGVVVRKDEHADGPHCVLDGNLQPSRPPLSRRSSSGPPRSQTWKRLTELKDKIKQLHEKIHYIRMVDVELQTSIWAIKDIGAINIGILTMAVDTRQKTVDRGRLFRHKKVSPGAQRPAEWIFVVKGVSFTPEGKESLEIVDIGSLNVHGLLYKDLAGLRDASISLKLGRIHIPYDNIALCLRRIESCRNAYGGSSSVDELDEVSIADIMEEYDMPGSREEKIVQTVSDSKEFISSLLRGIQEIQLAVSFIGMSKEINPARTAKRSLYLNLTMNEVGIDLFRLDPKSPAHRMYFSPKDIAHQALLAAISIAVSVDDGEGKPDRLLYVPMTTATIKTTLPSKTISESEDKDAAERNANMLFANLVVTSPSIDLDPRHFPVVPAILRSRRTSDGTSKTGTHRHHLISRLLPKASIKFSVQEPVVRIVLPPTDPALRDSDDYDILISSISSISLDLESSHSSAGELHYALTSGLRITSQQLYYQTALGQRHNLLLVNALELSIEVFATPQIEVVVTGNLQTLSVHMVRPEINSGMNHIFKHLKQETHVDSIAVGAQSKQISMLRKFPMWLKHVQLHGSDFMVEVAGVDVDVSEKSRGVALQLDSWTAEYNIKKGSDSPKLPKSHHSAGNSFSNEAATDSSPVTEPTASSCSNSSDGRRLVIHIQGFRGFVVEELVSLGHEPFVSMPRFEVAMSTSTDYEGPVCHLQSYVKALYLQYSLYHYYAIGFASTIFRRSLLMGEYESGTNHVLNHASEGRHSPASTSGIARSDAELLTVDIKTSLLQIKTTMPADPSMLFQVYGLEAGRHRWAAPFMRSRLIRAHVKAPKVKHAWARIISIKRIRVDLRDSRKRVGKHYVEEKSIDVALDFIRLAVPHQVVVHRVFDNFTNLLKSTEQLNYRFRTGTNEYILKKRPVLPREVPRISVRCKAMLFELEDGPFDWKLGVLYRVGLNEQKQRLARDEAFRIKSKKLDEQNHRRDPSRLRTHSTHPDGRGRSKRSDLSVPRERNKSTDVRPRGRSASHAGHGKNRMRYDPEAICSLTSSAKVSYSDAWLRLQEYNARSWKRRVDGALWIQRNSMKEIRRMFGGDDELPDNIEDSEVIVSMPDRPGLMATLISDLHIVVDKPSFPLKDYNKFLHTVGKGMPYDMEYSLLIPMSVQINMGEARVTLRDYPLPLLHVPAIKPGQSPRLPSWSLQTDFVVAEEYRDDESTKQVRVQIVPPDKMTSPTSVTNGFCVDVRRTVSPVKTYSNTKVAINTSNPTSISWGTSYQPAIQEMMQIIESFTKPQADPSDRVGFWDKIRLTVHSRVNVSWKGDGDVHLKLKGSRSPYVVTGHGAGFVMCFRNNVCWEIHPDDDPKRFMTVTSSEYVLAIPDYSHQARQTVQGMGKDNESLSSTDSQNQNAMFKKVIMKLSGNVRWLAGLVFERDIEHGGRSFASKPHYQIAFKTPQFAKSSSERPYDAFRGFRSQYIHLSIAVVAPADRDWSLANTRSSSSYNSVHLSPRFFTHFFDWWSLFSGVMSLPIRQGKLFPGIEKSSKKFGRHLATIKYNLLLSPLFIAHVYKHKDAEDYSQETVGATGLKLRLDSFMLDLHQRREEFLTQGKGRVRQTRTTGMRINQAQLDFISADIRAVSASIAGTSPEDLKRATDEDLTALQEQIPASPDASRFTIPDGDLLWIDMDDFVELDWILPAETHPETKIMPLAFSPRFTYFRQTDHRWNVSGDPTRTSAFEDEPTHYCIMSHDNDPQKVQCDLVKERLCTLDAQLIAHQHSLNEVKLRVNRDGHRDSPVRDQYETLKQQVELLAKKRHFMQSMFDRLSQHLAVQCNDTIDNAGPEDNSFNAENVFPKSPQQSESKHAGSGVWTDFASNFNNRFTVHNVQLKWNNSLRNIILRYVHQVSQRRGFIYYMSRRAVKFILDIVDEQKRSKERKQEQSYKNTPTGTHPSPSMSFSFKDEGTDYNLEERIQELLRDGKAFVDADDATTPDLSQRKQHGNIDSDISEEYTAQNSYHVRLIAPQFQLQSEKNPKSVLLLTAKGLELKVIQIMDRSRIADDVSGLVQRRFGVDMDAVQFFVTNQKTLIQYVHLYSGNRYGAPKGSSWPPWVPLEANFDFQLNPFGWSRVAQKTSATLRYDKYNTLRLKYNDEVSKGETIDHRPVEDPESRIDHIWVDFPQIRAICDSTQYYAMYLIVLDLLLYNEPLEKIRSERLEKIMLAADFSDLTGAPEMVVSLQERIRQLEEIKGHFQIYAKYLDRQGWQDRLYIERDLTSCEDELFFMMKAITTSQRKNDDRAPDSQSNGLLRWYLSASEIVWHLMREKNEPLMEIQLKHATYDRTDNSDGSNHNTMEIERIHGWNLLPDALYPEMIAPYFENGQSSKDGHGRDIKMFKMQWYMLEAIAGIPVLDQFEVNLFPIKVQLEREVGKKVFEYIFPGNTENGNPSPLMVKHMVPLQDDDDDSDLEPSMPSSPHSPIPESEEPGTRPGSLELRLKPTLGLPDPNGRSDTAQSKGKMSGPPSLHGESHHRFKLFQASNRSQSATRSPAPPRPEPSRSSTRRRSGESLRSLARSSRETPSNNASSMNVTVEKTKRFGIHRSMSKDSTAEKEKASDNLTQMLSRASNYMTLSYVKIPSVVLCLSYKGRGERNIEDVHNFVFRMPSLEYRNKTWSNLDLALRLKKDIIKALISHTGAIISNKFSQHRPNKHQQSRLREIASSASILPNTNSLTNTLSRTASVFHSRPRSNERPETAKKGFAVGWDSQTRGPDSETSSLSIISTADRGPSARGMASTSSPAINNITQSEPVSEPSSLPGSEEEEAKKSTVGSNLQRFKKSNLLARRVTSESHKAWQRESSGTVREGSGATEHEEKPRRASVLHFGKKILGTLN